MSEAAPTKGERSKAKLVAATADLLRRQGYHATGLAEIVAESGAPRGSLYFYFPGGKDELACAALRAAGEQWRHRIDVAIRGLRDAGAVIDAIVELLASDLEASSFEHGCPVAAVALEATSPAVRAAIEEHYATWQATITERIVQFGLPKAIAPQVATAALAMVEGAMLLAKVSRSRAPLVIAGQALRTMVAAFVATVPAASPIGAPASGSAAAAVVAATLPARPSAAAAVAAQKRRARRARR